MRFASLLLFFVPFTVAIPIRSSGLNRLIGATESQLENISLRLYTGTTIDDYTSVLIGDAEDLLPEIDPKKPTVVYIFGWTETPNIGSAVAIVSAYLERQDHNVILVDWEEIAAGFYVAAVFSANNIGSSIAEALNKLVASGLDSTTLHIVSHSLGSQIAGYVGKNVDFVLPRITGLDPAGPGFYFIFDGLTSADAEFVDVIHTDAGLYGTILNQGTVNFYPNGGTRYQPGCLTSRTLFSVEDYCDHQRSFEFYAESLINEDAFIGLECDSYSSFEQGSCSSNEKVVMGFGTPNTSSGNIYLQTNSEAPYGRGEDGDTYVA